MFSLFPFLDHHWDPASLEKHDDGSRKHTTQPTINRPWPGDSPATPELVASELPYQSQLPTPSCQWLDLLCRTLLANLHFSGPSDFALLSWFSAPDMRTESGALSGSISCVLPHHRPHQLCAWPMTPASKCVQRPGAQSPSGQFTSKPASNVGIALLAEARC